MGQRRDAVLFRAPRHRSGARSRVRGARRRAGRPPAVVLSHAFWQRRLGARRDVIGSTVRLDGRDHLLVGVLPPQAGPLGQESDVFVATQFTTPPRRDHCFCTVLGRLRRTADREAAAAELRAINRRIFPLWRSSHQDDKATWSMMDLQVHVVGESSTTANVALAAVVLVWLLGVRTRRISSSPASSAAAASWRFGRPSARRAPASSATCWSRARVWQEVRRRSAARSRGRESSCFETLARAIWRALARSTWTRTRCGSWLRSRLRARCSSGSCPRCTRRRSLRRHPAIAGALVERQPGAPQAARRARGNAVRDRHAAADGRRAPVGQPARARASGRRVRHATPFERAVSVPEARYPGKARVTAFWDELRRRVAALPGVSSVAFSDGRPPDDVGNFNNFDLEDAPTPQSPPVAPWVAVSPETQRLGLSLLDGRTLDETDAAPGARSGRRGSGVGETILPERACRGQTLPGRRLHDLRVDHRRGRRQQCEARRAEPSRRGCRLLADAARLAGAVPPGTAADPETTVPSIRQVLRRWTRKSLSGVTTIDLVAQSLERPRSLAALVGAFAIVALLLSVVGIYGVMVLRGTPRAGHQHPPRAGGTPRTVLQLILGRGMSVVLGGIGVGVLGSSCRRNRSALRGRRPGPAGFPLRHGRAARARGAGVPRGGGPRHRRGSRDGAPHGIASSTSVAPS